MTVHLRFESPVPAAPDVVWRRVTSAEGIDDEFRPWLGLRLPRPYRDSSLDDVPVGHPLGRAWLLLGGVLPVEYDELRLVDIVPGRSFDERSTMLTMARWNHSRTLVPSDGATTVIDELAFELRAPLRPVTHVARRLVRTIFEHRHRRLRRWAQASMSSASIS